MTQSRLEYVATLRWQLAGLILVVVLGLTGCWADPNSTAEQPKLDTNAKPISEERFWELLDSVERTSDHQKRRKDLQAKLETWDESDLKGYKLRYIEEFNKLNRNDILAVFNIINKMEDYEAFFSFRDQLIAQGSESYRAVMDDPQCLLDHVSGLTFDIQDTQFYMCGDSVVASRSQKKFDGLHVPMNFVDEPYGETVDIFDEKLIEKRFPRVWEFVERRNRMEAKELFGQ